MLLKVLHGFQPQFPYLQNLTRGRCEGEQGKAEWKLIKQELFL